MRQRLRIRTSYAEPLAFVVEHEHWNAQNHANTTEDKSRYRQLPLRTRLDVVVERPGVEGGKAGQEVATEAIAPSGRRGERTIGSHHVVDGCHVDGEVRDADERREDQRHDPVHLWWTKRTEPKTKKTNRLK